MAPIATGADAARRAVGAFHLLDGDKIAVLLAQHMAQLVQQACLALRVGLVQTAYANGSATRYAVDTLVRGPRSGRAGRAAVA